MKNLLMTASLAFALGFVGFSGCAMSSEDPGEPGALNNVEQDLGCAECKPTAHVNGVSCNSTASVKA